MTPLVVALVLGAALLHAAWNAMAKSSGAPEFSIAAYTLVGSVAAFGMMVWVPHPEPASWPFIGASVAIHNLYFFALAQAYRAGDLSLVYPFFRGLAPVLIALVAAVVAGEWLTPGTWIGVGLVSAGIVGLGLRRGAVGTLRGPALRWGATTSCLIAVYTVVDGLGVRAAGSGLGYILWVFGAGAFPIVPIMIVARRRAWLAYLRERPGQVLFGGLASSLGYGMVIFAMSLAPMAVVASLRETSVIFAAVIGAIVLHEPFGTARVRAASVVVLGLLVMRLFG